MFLPIVKRIMKWNYNIQVIISHFHIFLETILDILSTNEV
jgi:hypothetical protein